MARESSIRRTLVAVGVAVAGCLFIWVATPYNNFILGNAYISDDYMPPAGLFVMLLLVLGANPVLRRLAPRYSLSTGQLAVVFAVVLAACVTPSQGLLRELPYGLAGSCVRVSHDKKLAEAYKKLDPPASLFPDRLAYGVEPAASSPFITELGRGESIPWGAWVAPLFAWMGLFIPWWVMMTALAVIVLPQWRDNERQPFPLLAVQQALIEDPGTRGPGTKKPGKRFAFSPIFRSRAFWAAAGVVFALHFLAGANQYFPGKVPEVPLTWDLGRLFTEEPLNYMPYWMRSYRIHFIFLGVAFFMPNRVGFSIWFFQVAYAAYVVFGRAYAPPFHWSTMTDHRIGAFFVFPLAVVWLGRRHWAHVFRCVFRWKRSTDKDAQDEQDSSSASCPSLSGVLSEADRRDRAAGIAFLLGCLGLLVWFVWVGVQPHLALILVFLAFLYAVAITRAVTETGLPLIAPDTSYGLTLARLMPQGWRTAASMYFSGMFSFVIGHMNRPCATTLLIHGIGMDRKARPRKQMRLAGLLLGVIVVSVVVCGSVHLYASYNHSMTLDGRLSPISGWGGWWLGWTGEKLLKEWHSGSSTEAAYNRPLHIAFGAVLAGVLQWLCQLSPSWPLHPVALLFVGNWYAHRVWVNVFFGWLAKVLILRYGGHRVYKKAAPVFVGIIMGEVIAVAFWCVTTGIVAALGYDYKTVVILPF